MIEQEIFYRLRDYAGLAALIGGRVYAMVAPQGATFPLCVFSRISAAPVNDLGGYSGLQSCRFQVDCYGTGYTATKEVTAQVVAAMTSAPTFRALRTGDRDLYESNGLLHRVILDFSIWTN